MLLFTKFMIIKFSGMVDRRNINFHPSEFSTATSIYRVHFLSTLRVLLYRDTIDRVLFYIEMTVMMSDYPHKVLKLVCQAMVEIFANFVA